MDFSRCFPPKKTSHFPIDKSYNPVIVHYTVGLGKIIMHEAHVWVGVGVREEDIRFEGTNTAVGENIGILDDMVASSASISGLDSVQQSQYLSCLLFK